MDGVKRLASCQKVTWMSMGEQPFSSLPFFPVCGLVCFRSSPKPDHFPPHLLKIQVAAVQEVPSIPALAGSLVPPAVYLREWLVRCWWPWRCPLHVPRASLTLCLFCTLSRPHLLASKPCVVAGAYDHLRVFHSKPLAHFTQTFLMHLLTSQKVPTDPNKKNKTKWAAFS